ncbi:glycosyl hydrolase family 3 N terminal domain-containing protein [Cladorrhinum sp. PSN259]|nr:glycosyl hydrolase family 3 N terminal domain-containing protein [Cladorrhinum sp. PSN259]
MKPLLCLLLYYLPLIHALVDVPLPDLFPSPWLPSGEEDPAYILARDFVSRLTLPEKVNITTGTGWQTTRCIGSTGSVPRLNFSSLCLMDGPLGVRYTDLSSAFPAGINAAATFSKRLLRARGRALGAEFKGKGVDVMLGPASGPLGRAPKGGRNWEGFGSDPFLAGVAMGETIKGIQEKGVIACAKHYVLNEQEHFRGSVDVRIRDRVMHEVYLWPFVDSVRAGVGSVMCSYNKVNGSWACENEWTGGYLLKKELGFKGFLMSDWGAQHTAFGSALAGGLDMAMPGDGLGAPGGESYNGLWGGALTEAVLKGDVPEWRVDDMVMRIMRAYFSIVSKTVERPGPNFSAWTNKTIGPLYHAANASWQEVNLHVDVQADHGELIREIGAKSTVLLKNKGVLPLSPTDIDSIAVIGNDAQDYDPNTCPERACLPRPGTVAMGYGSGTTEFPYLISPATAISRRCSQHNITFFNTTSNWDLPTAKSVASSASVAIVFAAAIAGENFVSIDGNVGDRNNLTLWDNGDALISAVASVNPNTIVVLHTPGPVLLSYAKSHPNISAILWAGFPGQESGNSLADILFGDVPPQGRSPFTWAAQEKDYGPTDIMTVAADPRNPSQTFDEGVYIDYRWFDRHNITPVWEFGFGLSYTSFEYANLTVTKLVPSSSPISPFPPPVVTQKNETGPAPTIGTTSKNLTEYLPPAGFENWKITPFVYPYLNSSSAFYKNPNGTTTTPTAKTQFPAAAFDGSSQEVHPAGGGEGGNPALFETLFEVRVSVTNTGRRKGVEIGQLVCFFFFFFLFFSSPHHDSFISLVAKY